MTSEPRRPWDDVREHIEERRQDAEFRERLLKTMDENADILDALDDNPPLVAQEPGDEADHLSELQLYWPFVGAEAWALGLEVSEGGELEDVP